MIAAIAMDATRAARLNCVVIVSTAVPARHPDDLARIGSYIKDAARRFGEAPDACLPCAEQPLLQHDAAVFDRDPIQVPLRHRADQQAAAPLRKLIASIDKEAAWCDGRRPHPYRLLHAVPLDDALADRAAVVLPPVGDDRPSVIRAFLDDVQLVSAKRSVLRLPEHACDRIERESLRIAMTVAPDFRPCVLGCNKGIVRRHAAIVRETQNLAGVSRQLLRALFVVSVADAEK